eukprot:scaffold27185_cov97-Isochrysis_galbana.AAC.9
MTIQPSPLARPENSSREGVGVTDTSAAASTGAQWRMAQASPLRRPLGTWSVRPGSWPRWPRRRRRDRSSTAPCGASCLAASGCPTISVSYAPPTLPSCPPLGRSARRSTTWATMTQKCCGSSARARRATRPTTWARTSPGSVSSRPSRRCSSRHAPCSPSCRSRATRRCIRLRSRRREASPSSPSACSPVLSETLSHGSARARIIGHEIISRAMHVCPRQFFCAELRHVLHPPSNFYIPVCYEPSGPAVVADPFVRRSSPTGCARLQLLLSARCGATARNTRTQRWRGAIATRRMCSTDEGYTVNKHTRGEAQGSRKG